MKSKVIDLDFVRATAIVFVVGIHVTAPFVVKSSLAFYLNNMMSSAVFLFLMVSGSSLWYGSQGRELSYIQFIGKRMDKVLLPYVLWTLFYVSYLHEIWGLRSFHPSRINGEFWHKAIDGLMYGNAMYHLYFMLILIPLYFLFPLIKRFCDDRLHHLLILSFLLWVFSYSVKEMASEHLSVWGYYQPMNWLFYFVVGIYAVKHLEKIRQCIKGKELILGAVWLFSYVLHTKIGVIESVYQGIPIPVRHLYNTLSLILLMVLASQLFDLSNRIGKYAEYLSRHSFFIYFSHPFFLIVYEKLTFRCPQIVQNNGLDIVMMFAFAFAGSLILAHAVSFLPLSQYIGAAKKAKKEKLGGKP